jgi:glycosyltransferase involved in cell wall biosynthesis
VTSSLPEVSVIIPTLAAAERAESLERAIASVRSQEGVRAVPVISINGARRHAPVLTRLRADPALTLVDRPEPGIPGALRAGRATVRSPWFTALDDDDVLLPGTLAARVRVLTEQPGCRAVVTNGFRRNGSGDVLHVKSPASVRSDPLGYLLETNWLLPGSWLCRTADFGPEFFDAMPRYLECTYLAVRLATSGRLEFLDQPGVIWQAGRLGSESWSRPHRLGEADALARILELPLPRPFRAELERRHAAACHSISDVHRLEGSGRDAWSWHWRSLRGRGGYRYLLYTRRLLGAIIRW